MYRSTFGFHSREQGFYGAPAEPSRLPKFVQARSAQHRLKMFSAWASTPATTKPTAVVQPISSQFFSTTDVERESISDKINAVKRQKYDFTEQSITQASKLGKILEYSEEPEGEISWNSKTAITVIEDSKKMKINQLEYDLHQMESQLQQQEIRLKSKEVDLNHRVMLSENYEKEKRLLQELVKKSKDAHFEAETQLFVSQKLNARNEKYLADMQNELDQEKNNRSGAERENKRLTIDLKESIDALAIVEMRLKELQTKLNLKQEECEQITRKVEQDRSTILELQEKLKITQEKMAHVEQSLSKEKFIRQTVEQSEANFRKEYDEILIKFEKLLADHSADIEKIGLKSAEISRTKQELDQVTRNHHLTLNIIKEKFSDQILAINQKASSLAEEKTRLERACNQSKMRLEEVSTELEASLKDKQNMEIRKNKAEIKAFEYELRIEELRGLMAEMAGQKFKILTENEKTKIILKNAEDSINTLSVEKKNFQRQLCRTTVDLDQAKQKNDEFKMHVRISEDNSEMLQHQLAELENSNDNLTRQLKNANNECNVLIVTIHENELLKIQDLEDQKKYFENKIAVYIEEAKVLANRISSLEKLRASLVSDLQTTQDSLETALNLNTMLARKVKTYEKSLAEYVEKCKNTFEEIKSLRDENRTITFVVNKLQLHMDEASMEMAKLRKENDDLLSEIRSLNQQLAQALENFREVENRAKKVFGEKEWLQKCLNESEKDVESKNDVISKLQLEIDRFKITLEEIIAEKSAEFEIIRKSLISNIEELKLSLESEVQHKLEISKQLKISEESASNCLDLLEQTRLRLTDSLNQIKKVQDQNKMLSTTLIKSEDIRKILEEKFAQVEIDLVVSTKQCEEYANELRQARAENCDLREKIEIMTRIAAEKSAELNFIISQRKGLEKDFLELQSQYASQQIVVTETENNLAITQVQKSLVDRELIQERESVSIIKQKNLSLETKILECEEVLRSLQRETKIKIEEAVKNSEERLLKIETDFAGEKAAHLETKKRHANVEKQMKEAQFIANEEKKRSERMTDLVANLEQKLLIYKQQREDAVNFSSMSHSRYRTLNTDLVSTVKRADLAEKSLSRIRSEAKGRIRKTDFGSLRTNQPPSSSAYYSTQRSRIF